MSVRVTEEQREGTGDRGGVSRVAEEKDERRSQPESVIARRVEGEREREEDAGEAQITRARLPASGSELRRVAALMMQSVLA